MFPEFLQEFDATLFKIINVDFENDIFDFILPFIRQSQFWIPLYFFIIYLSFKRWGTKAILWICIAIITITLSDQISSQLIKKTVLRLRPCNNQDILAYLILRVKNCSTGFSFTSSHATNHFAFAYFLCNTLGKNYFPKWLHITFFLWALVIGFAQIYVGVHYPTDVFCGSILGITIGSVGSYLFNIIFSRVK